jgi:hypothetical protein
LGPALPTPSERPASVDIEAASRDSLVAWLEELTWLNEAKSAELGAQASLCAAQMDSLQRRLDLAEARLQWEQQREPWWLRWLLPVAVTAGVAVGALAVR